MGVVQVPMETRSPGTGVTHGCDALGVGAGNRAQVMCMLFTAKSSLQVLSVCCVVGWSDAGPKRGRRGLRSWTWDLRQGASERGRRASLLE